MIVTISRHMSGKASCEPTIRSRRSAVDPGRYWTSIPGRRCAPIDIMQEQSGRFTGAAGPSGGAVGRLSGLLPVRFSAALAGFGEARGYRLRHRNTLRGGCLLRLSDFTVRARLAFGHGGLLHSRLGSPVRWIVDRGLSFRIQFTVSKVGVANQTPSPRRPRQFELPRQAVASRSSAAARSAGSIAVNCRTCMVLLPARSAIVVDKRR
jgi:hypothetical protein